MTDPIDSWEADTAEYTVDEDADGDIPDSVWMEFHSSNSAADVPDDPDWRQFGSDITLTSTTMSATDTDDDPEYFPDRPTCTAGGCETTVRGKIAALMDYPRCYLHREARRE